MEKSADAFRTIAEVSELLDIAPHVLRFWEQKFSQIKPLKRGGGRRYYRPADIALIAGIRQLLHEDGLTIRGAQKRLQQEGVQAVQTLGRQVMDSPPPGAAPAGAKPQPKASAPKPAAAAPQAGTSAPRARAPKAEPAEESLPLFAGLGDDSQASPAPQASTRAEDPLTRLAAALSRFDAVRDGSAEAADPATRARIAQLARDLRALVGAC